MRLVSNAFVAAGVMCAVAAAPSQGQAQTLTALGDLPGGDFYSKAIDVSADGSVIVGVSTGEKGREAVRWTKDGGMQGLGDLPGGSFHSEALGVSADGSIIVGFGTGEKGPEGFRWTKENGMVGLGGFPPTLSVSLSCCVSEDGSVVLGWSHGMTGVEAFRWTKETEMQGLGHLNGVTYYPFSAAYGVSESGSVLVGYSIINNTEAFRWTEETGMQGLGDLPGGKFHSQAFVGGRFNEGGCRPPEPPSAGGHHCQE